MHSAVLADSAAIFNQGGLFMDDRDYLIKAQQGDDAAAWYLVNRCAKIISSIINRHSSAYFCIPREDLICEGQRGVLEAIRRYNQEYKVQFTTYAYLWIKKYVCQCIRKTTAAHAIPDGAGSQHGAEIPVSARMLSLTSRDRLFLKNFCSLKMAGGRKALEDAAAASKLTTVEAVMALTRIRGILFDEEAL